MDIESIVVSAQQGELEVGEVFVRGDECVAAGDVASVKRLYEAWFEGRPDHHLNYAVYYNYSVVLMRVGDNHTAVEALRRSVELNPAYAPAQINLGVALEQTEGKHAAIAQWLRLSELMPQVTSDNVQYVKMAFSMAGRVLEELRNLSGAEEAFRRSLDLDFDQSEVLQHYISVIQQQCKWPIIKPWGGVKGVNREMLVGGINPLTLAIYSDDPLFQLANSAHYGRKRAGRPAVSYVSRHEALRGPAPERLKIGYVSAELRNHAGGYLMAEVFELHDKSRFEIFAYNTIRAGEGDALAARIGAAADHWVDIADLDDAAAGARIAEDGIHILLDMQGHTHGSRPGLMATRPAPVIAGWLGFPGSVGSPYHNWLIADDFIVPPDHEPFYSERIARLPCYQPNDRRRVVSAVTPSRAEAGLPEGVTVYCAFNGQHKISEPCWARWMRILSAVEGSVLWLLDSTAEINERLKSLAEEQGVSADRILFAPRIGNADHLARYPLADLFLDTFPYGAHTTASDAMWMGVPILTLAGRSFASRVCGSIISAAGLPDLIATDAEEYVERAIALGRDRALLQSYRDRLKNCRESSVLFDTPGLVRSLEQRFGEMWQAWHDGVQTPPDLTNIELYRDIAIGFDEIRPEVLSVSGYLDFYRQKLTTLSDYTFVPQDGRAFR
jgi:predicted O-linked N-acetylglucosamine transferase (SPINDLY family)